MANKVMLSGEFRQDRVRVGDLFQVVEDGEVYIFSRVSKNKFAFICLNDGNRRKDAFEFCFSNSVDDEGISVEDAIKYFTTENINVRWLGACEILVKRC